MLKVVWLWLYDCMTLIRIVSMVGNCCEVSRVASWWYWVHFETVIQEAQKRMEHEHVNLDYSTIFFYGLGMFGVSSSILSTREGNDGRGEIDPNSALQVQWLILWNSKRAPPVCSMICFNMFYWSKKIRIFMNLLFWKFLGMEREHGPKLVTNKNWSTIFRSKTWGWGNQFRVGF